MTHEPTRGEIQAYEARSKALRAHAEKIRAELRAKYGPPVTRAETEWARPGLHVTYTAGELRDIVLIEVTSVHNERDGRERRERESKEAGEPKI